MAPRGRAAQPPRDTRKTNKQSNQLSLPHQDECNTRMDIINVQQNKEQIQTPTMGVTINKKSTTTEPPQNLTIFSMHPFPPGGTLIFSYIRRLGPFFWIQNVEFQYYGVFRKNEYFFGYEDFVDIVLGSLQNWANFKVFLCILGSFLKVNIQNGNIFGGCQKFKYFDIPDIYF